MNGSEYVLNGLKLLGHMMCLDPCSETTRLSIIWKSFKLQLPWSPENVSLKENPVYCPISTALFPPGKYRLVLGTIYN